MRKESGTKEIESSQKFNTHFKVHKTTMQRTKIEQHKLIVLGMGGTIDKDYPRSTGGYAFEIDEPAAERILKQLPSLNLQFEVRSICRKDSTEIDAFEREKLVAAIRAAPPSARIVVTHGTDTLIETAKVLVDSGAAEGKRVAFTGAMKPERFKDSDASFNLGGAVIATAQLPLGSVVVCMGGNVIQASVCVRDKDTGFFCEQNNICDDEAQE
uniref:L-asparaginase N-terminal domain-containing protein n=1 Tax=Proboscia inermis TaxID=420281 RepID=A0A7S0BW39_9STRA|mmetsp:Transcript_10545/g.10625  ORF Transcript_10545/g.10625 Transcript_10545/m.10625 type:complete len:213 (+) Transcript_10545:47-685(+)